LKLRKTLSIGLTFLLAGQVNGQSIEDEAVTWLQEFIQVDTINPPGNEFRAVDFYSKIFEAEGIGRV
jgi:hypothetical protein